MTTKPASSSAVLVETSGQQAEFSRDVIGEYQLTYCAIANDEFSACSVDITIVDNTPNVAPTPQNDEAELSEDSEGHVIFVLDNDTVNGADDPIVVSTTILPRGIVNPLANRAMQLAAASRLRLTKTFKQN